MFISFYKEITDSSEMYYVLWRKGYCWMSLSQQFCFWLVRGQPASLLCSKRVNAKQMQKECSSWLSVATTKCPRWLAEKDRRFISVHSIGGQWSAGLIALETIAAGGYNGAKPFTIHLFARNQETRGGRTRVCYTLLPTTYRPLTKSHFLKISPNSSSAIWIIGL